MNFSSFFSSRFFSPQSAGALLLAVLSGVSLARCAATADESSDSVRGGSLDSASQSIFEFPSGNADADSDGSSVDLSRLCGRGTCDPDLAELSDSMDCGLASGGGAGGAGAGGSSSIDMPVEGNGGGGDLIEDPELIACSVLKADGCKGSTCELERRCSSVGESQVGEACTGSHECVAGSACVSDSAGGICQEYCCAGESSCNEEEYCVTSELFEDSELAVPICRATGGCQLSFEGCDLQQGACGCDPGLACLVVTPNGAVACAEPGRLREGDECTQVGAGQCAPGLICSSSAGCLKLCEPGDPIQCSTGQECQTPSQLDGRFGVCVEGKNSSVE